MFNPDAFFWRWCSHILDLMVLSLLWFFCSLPIVTIGAASTALYDAALHGIRRGEPGVVRRFFATFRAEWKPATLATLLFGGLLALVWLGYALMGLAFAESGADLAQVGLAAYAVLGLFVLGYLSWLFALLARYEYSFGALCRTAWQFTLVHLPTTAGLAVSLATGIWLCTQFIIPLFFVPAVQASLAARLAERAFAKHQPAGADAGESTPPPEASEEENER